MKIEKTTLLGLIDGTREKYRKILKENKPRSGLVDSSTCPFCKWSVKVYDGFYSNFDCEVCPNRLPDDGDYDNDVVYTAAKCRSFDSFRYMPDRYDPEDPQDVDIVELRIKVLTTWRRLVSKNCGEMVKVQTARRLAERADKS